jgi:hypothetical protein
VLLQVSHVEANLLMFLLSRLHAGDGGGPWSSCCARAAPTDVAAPRRRAKLLTLTMAQPGGGQNAPCGGCLWLGVVIPSHDPNFIFLISQ